MIIYKDFHKKYFERLAWVHALLSNVLNNKKIKKLINKNFKEGVFVFILFDNYKYFTGAIVSKTKNTNIEIICPKNVLDIKDPVHWKKKGSEYLSRSCFINLNKFENFEQAITIMDIRQFLRIINSKKPIKAFVNLSYNGVIHTELSNKLWLPLRLRSLLDTFF